MVFQLVRKVQEVTDPSCEATLASHDPCPTLRIVQILSVQVKDLPRH